MDFGKIMELKKNVDVLKGNHPKFFGFVKAVKSKALKEGSVFEIKVTTPEGENLETAIKLTQSDLDALQNLLSMESVRKSL